MDLAYCTAGGSVFRETAGFSSPPRKWWRSLAVGGAAALLRASVCEQSPRDPQSESLSTGLLPAVSGLQTRNLQSHTKIKYRLRIYFNVHSFKTPFSVQFDCIFNGKHTREL